MVFKIELNLSILSSNLAFCPIAEEWCHEILVLKCWVMVVSWVGSWSRGPVFEVLHCTSSKLILLKEPAALRYVRWQHTRKKKPKAQALTKQVCPKLLHTNTYLTIRPNTHKTSQSNTQAHHKQASPHSNVSKAGQLNTRTTTKIVRKPFFHPKFFPTT